MANLAWYNDNQNRDYPFLTRVQPLNFNAPLTGIVDPDISSSSINSNEDLPHGIIVDFGVIMEVDSGFDEDAGHFVYLLSVERIGTLFEFRFVTNAFSSTEDLIFRRDLTDPEFQIEWADSTTPPATFDQLNCADRPRWSGWMVTGAMELVDDTFPVDGTYTFSTGLWQIEPARIQNLNQTYLRSINLANTPRSTVSDSPGCEPSMTLSSSSMQVDDVIVQSTCINGAIAFKEGYNCIIRQDSSRNQLTIGAGVGLGDGEPCAEVPLSSDEVSPDGGAFLSGGPSCAEIIKSINGISAQNFTLVAGPGYRIQPDPVQKNKLCVTRVRSDFAVCAIDEEPAAEPFESASLSSSLSSFSNSGSISVVVIRL